MGVHGGIVWDAIGVIVEELVKHVRNVICLGRACLPGGGGDADGDAEDGGDPAAGVLA